MRSPVIRAQASNRRRTDKRTDTITDVHEKLPEQLTATTEHFDIHPAIGGHFRVEVIHAILGCLFLFIPFDKVRLLSWAHGFDSKIGGGGKGYNLVPVFGAVEAVRERSFGYVRQTKRFRPGSKALGAEGVAVTKLDVESRDIQLHYLPTIHNDG